MTLSRRDVMKHSVGTGFALAVLPIAESAFATDAQGLEVGMVDIPTANGKIPAYRAAPKEPKAKAPVLLVVHEIFGLHEHIKDVCRRLAKLGYFAIAPDLFVRQGDATQIADIKELQQKIVSQTPDAQVAGDLDATVAWAATEAHADVQRLAITGFCWGGRVTWLYAAHQPRVRAGVAWYGKLTGEKDARRPSHPLDLVGELKAAVLGLYGGKDQGISLQSVEQMRQALAASSNAVAKRCQIHVYPDAGHAFAADYRPSYNKADAEDGYRRLHAFLTSALGASTK
jgi:carboxymethylenebutenolidase